LKLQAVPQAGANLHQSMEANTVGSKIAVSPAPCCSSVRCSFASQSRLDDAASRLMQLRFVPSESSAHLLFTLDYSCFLALQRSGVGSPDSRDAPTFRID